MLGAKHFGGEDGGAGGEGEGGGGASQVTPIVVGLHEPLLDFLTQPAASVTQSAGLSFVFSLSRKFVFSRSAVLKPIFQRHFLD